MRRYLKLLLIAALMMPLTVMAQETNCTLTVEWGDASGNGWVGDADGGNRHSVLRFYQDGLLLDTLSPANGASGTMQLTVSNADLLLVWKQGDYDNQCSFTLLSAGGAHIYECLSADFGEGDTIVTVVNPCSECFPVSGVRIDSLGLEAVWLAWNAGSAEYDIEYGDRGFTPGNGVTISTDTNAALIEGLVPGMMYDVYAYSLCDGQRTEPTLFSFITPGDTVTEYPYVSGFEPGDDCGWTFVQGGVNRWNIGSGAASEGDFGLYISNDGGESNAYSNVPTLSYAFRTFSLDTGTYVLSFDYRVEGDATTDYMHVFLVPGDIEFTADQIPGSASSLMYFRYSTQLPQGWTNIGYTNSTRYYGNHPDWTTKQATVDIAPGQAGAYNLLFLWVNNQAGTLNLPAAIDNVVVARNTCPAPTGFACDSATADQAWLSWTNGSNEELWQLSVDGGEWEYIYENPTVLYDLIPGTAYNVRLRAACDGDDNSLYTQLTFSTACPDSLRVFPYTERFESYTTGTTSTMNPCWKRGSIGQGGQTPYVQSASGNRYLQFSNSGLQGGNFGYVILPPIAGEVSEMQVSLDLRRFGSSRNDTLLVCLLPDTLLTANTIDTLAVLVATSQYFTRQHVRFDNYTGSNRRVALIAPGSHYNGDPFGSNPNNRPCVDNVSVYPIPTCEEPTGLNLVSVEEGALSISWNSVEGAHTYVVAHRTADSDEWSENETSDTAYTIEGLTPGTEYIVAVSNYCSYDDTSFAVSATYRTLCEPISQLPYTVAFGSDAELDCWTIIDANSDAATWGRNAQDALLEIESNAGADDWAVMPAISVPDGADGLTLTYQVAARFSSGSGAYELRLSTSGVAVTDFDTVLASETVGGTFVDRQVSLDAYAGQTVRLAFRYIASVGGTGLTVDNIRIRSAQMPMPTIGGPAYVGVGMQATFIATIAEGSTTGLNYQWTSTMQQGGHAVMATSADGDTLHISYDTLGTDTITVTATNDYGSGSALKVVPVVNISLATLPYQTGFESNDDNDWQSIGSTNKWHIGNATAQSGSRSLYISHNGGATAAYDTAAASVSYAIRPVDIDNEAEYTVSFGWRSMGENDGSQAVDYLRAFLVPSGITFEADIIPGGAEYTTDFNNAVPDSWIDLVPGVLQADSDAWQQHETTVYVSQGGAYNIVFIWMNDENDGNGRSAAIDNVRLRELSCFAPSFIVEDSVSASSLSFHWTPGGSETQWLVEVGGNETVVGTPHTTISGLNSGTHYIVSVRALCQNGDTSSAISTTLITDADCSPVELPWTETFAGWSRENNNYIHPCWKRFYTYPGGFSANDHVGSNPYVRSDDYYSETNALYMYSCSGGSTYFPMAFQSIAVLPQMAERDTAGISIDLSVRFFEFQYDPATGDTTVVDYLDVGYLSNENDPTSFVAAGTIDNIYAHDFTPVSIDIPTYTTNLGRLALRYRYTKPNDFYYVVIDDITVQPYTGEPVGPQPGDSTGIASASALQLAMHPNPANETVTISGIERGTQLSIVDLNGRTVLTLAATNNTERINVASLPRGIYFVRATATGTTSVGKLVIE